jgi:hypothetical protein
MGAMFRFGSSAPERRKARAWEGVLNSRGFFGAAVFHG